MTKKTEKIDHTKESEAIEECFIITPIGTLGSDIFNKAMGLIDAVIDPVLAERGMRALPANRMEDLGSINKQLIRRVVEDRLVIANLTGLNPNVMYELAIRHGARKPVIIMAEEGTRLPFDITDQRTIFYSDTLSGVESAKNELRRKIEFALEDESPDNPIYSYLESAKLFKEIDDNDPLKQILEKFEDLSAKVTATRYENSNLTNTGRTRIVENYDYKISVLVNRAKLMGRSDPTSDSVLNALDKVIQGYIKEVSENHISLSVIKSNGSGDFDMYFRCESESLINLLFQKISHDSLFATARLSPRVYWTKK